MKISKTSIAVLAAALATAATAGATVPVSLLVDIGRAAKVCHALSYGASHSAELTVRIPQSQALQLHSADAYPLDLVQVAGPAHVALPDYDFGSSTDRTLQFPKSGIYRFQLRPIIYSGPKPCTYQAGKQTSTLTVVVAAS